MGGTEKPGTAGMPAECNCLAIVTEKLREHSGDEHADVESMFLMIGNTIRCVPTLAWTRRGKDRFGKLKAKEERVYLRPKYCPFCGKMYDFAIDALDAKTEHVDG